MSSPLPQKENKNISKAHKSNITTPDEDNKKKLEKLYSIVDGRIEEKFTDLKTVQLEQGTKIDELIKEFNALCEVLKNPTPQTTAAAPQPQTGEKLDFKSLPPDVQMDALGKLMDGASKIVSAWKGPQTQSSPMGQLGEQMINDLVRTTIDDIQQRVYGIRKIPPSSVMQQATEQTHRLQ